MKKTQAGTLCLNAMSEFHFKTPLTEADVRQVSIGDSVYLDGIVFGVRFHRVRRLT